MLEVIMLGTGTPIADPKRCGSGTALVGENGWLLVDCGRGVTQRAIEAGLDLVAVEAVLLTHHHSDHVSDLATLAIARWSAGAIDPLIVIAPNGPCREYAGHCLDAYGDEAFFSQARPESGLRPLLDVRGFTPDLRQSEVTQFESWTISSALVDHHPIEAAVGYRVSDDAHVVALSGDTAACDGMTQLASNADLLIHEALNTSEVSQELLAWNASAESVGTLATEAGVKKLVLTHLLPPPDTAEAEQVFANQAVDGGFQGPISVAKDLMRFDFNNAEDGGQ